MHSGTHSPTGNVDFTDAPMLLATSRNELIPASQAVAMADALQSAGVESELVVLEGGVHGRHYHDRVWEASVAFLERHV